MIAIVNTRKLCGCLRVHLNFAHADELPKCIHSYTSARKDSRRRTTATHHPGRSPHAKANPSSCLKLPDDGDRRDPDHQHEAVEAYDLRSRRRRQTRVSSKIS